MFYNEISELYVVTNKCAAHQPINFVSTATKSDLSQFVDAVSLINVSYTSSVNLCKIYF